MKRVLFTALLVLLFSCGNDDDVLNAPDDLAVKDFMWKAMNLWYFWQAEIPNLADNKFTTDEAYTAFLRGESNPEFFIRNLLFTEDRFTFWGEDYEVLINSLSGISRSDGLQYFLIDLTTDDTSNLFGFVRNVAPDSDAAQKGMKRGDVFYAVDGEILNRANYENLLFGDNVSYTLSLGELDVVNRQVIQTNKKVALTKIENFQENPIRLATTLDINGQKIGYLMYRQFNANFNSELNAVFGQFVADGVTDLVLDMRYNGGGDVNTSRLLASMIYGKNKDELYIRQRWNAKIQPRLSKEFLEDYFADELKNGEPLNSLNLSRVFVIGTNRTASASELVMNGLDPYLDVIHIGDTTRGKNEFSISLVDDRENNYNYDPDRTSNINPANRWLIQPLVGRNENSVGFSDYTAGFIPDILLEEDIFNLGSFGDPNEPLLARAIEEITGIISKKTQKKASEAALQYREIETPVQELMILDKPIILN